MTESDAAAPGKSSAGWRIGWTHPVTLMLASAALSGAGWAFNHFFFERDRSDLRLEVEGLTQAVDLIARDQPHLENAPVYCDTAKLTLVLAHNGGGKQPILINRVAMNVDRLPSPPNAEKIACAIDTLASKPFGIVLRQTYVLEVSQSGPTGRFIESAKPGDALAVDPKNLLKIGSQKQAATLKPGEEPIGYDVFVAARDPGLYRVWFSADYDAASAKVLKTSSFLLDKQ